MREALAGDSPISEALRSLGVHDHVCLIYETRGQQTATAVPFVEIGLEHGEKCLFIADQKMASMLVDAVRAEGIDVDAAFEKGMLAVADENEAYLKNGYFDPDEMIGYLARKVGEAKSAGFPALRGAGEMIWVLKGDPGTERLMEYEVRINHFLSDHDAVILCQYDGKRFTPELILQVLRTHPLVIYGDHVCRNPYYIPQDEFLKPNQKELEVKRWLDNIQLYEKVERALRTARDEWEQSFNAIQDYICIVDRSGAILRANKSMCDRFELIDGNLVGLDYRRVYRASIEADAAARWEAPVAEESPVSFETKLPASDSWYLVSSYPLYDDKQSRWGAILMVRDISKRKRAEEELRRLSGRLLRLQDEERRKIARDLHDSTGQNLVVLAATIGQLRLRVPSSNRKARKLILESQALADQCIREIRTLAYVLHPPMLEEAGLEDAIRVYVDGFAKRSGIRVKLELTPNLGRLPGEVELSLFRVVQESLTNIQRHTRSRQAKIRIQRDSNRVTLEVSDKGRKSTGSGQKPIRGFTLGAGVGIPSMEERVKQIGGRLEIDLGNTGTTVRVTVPAND